MSADSLSRNPISVCLVQAVFSELPTLESGDMIPQIREVFRNEGFPFYELRKNSQINFINGKAEMRELNAHFLFNAEQTELIELTSSSFSYQTFSYTHFDCFEERFLNLYKKFYEACALDKSVFVRLGLRYVNAIQGKDWRKYINASCGTINPNIDCADLDSISSSSSSAFAIHLANGEYGSAIVKIIQNRSGLTIPPDIAVISPQRVQENVLITALDIDSFVQFYPKENVQPDISAFLKEIHDVSHELFMSYITKEALDEWK